MPPWASVSDKVAYPAIYVARLEALPINNLQEICNEIYKERDKYFGKK